MSKENEKILDDAQLDEVTGGAIGGFELCIPIPASEIYIDPESGKDIPRSYYKCSQPDKKGTLRCCARCEAM